MQIMSKSIDTTSSPDGAAADGRITQMLIAVKDKSCDTFTPEEWGMTAETAESVFMVLSGAECKPIYFTPKIGKNCSPGKKITLQSNMKFKGTVLIMNDQEGYELAEGEALIKAVKDACGEYPGLAVKAIGIELKPTNGDENLMQVRLENGDNAQLARVHIWQGNGQLVSLDGEHFMDLSAGMQVLVDADLNVFQALSFNPDKTPARPVYDEEISQPPRNNEGTAHVDGGCSANPNTPQLNGLGPVEAAVMVIMIGAAFRKRVHYSLADAIQSFLKNSDTSKKG